jgi:hypothetical protein
MPRWIFPDGVYLQVCADFLVDEPGLPLDCVVPEQLSGIHFC